MTNMSRRLAIHLAVAMLTLLLAPAALAQRGANSHKPITRVLNNFWDAMGREDGEAMKETLDWPVTIVEVSQTRNKRTTILHNPVEFDEELGRQRSPKAAETGKGEFYGVKPLAMKVQLLSPTVAYVSYTGRLPVRPGLGKAGATFSAVAVLRKLENPLAGWRIVFMTVPA